MYDVIVVGARVAGAATALLLARAGLSVLVVDRARFPSDTLSSHQIQPPGVALLRRWGVLDTLLAAGTPIATRATFDAGHTVIEGAYPSDGVCSPRRLLLDAALLAAARTAGAEVWEGFTVTGVRPGAVEGTVRCGPTRSATARFIVGADGKHSTVAKAFAARPYRTRPASSGAFYTYVDGLHLTAGEMYPRPDRLAAAWPTNDGLAVVYLAVPQSTFATTRAHLRHDFAGAFATCGTLPDRLRSSRIAERLRATTDLPNTFRVPYGPSWSLVGDAALVMDPITGQGIANALRDADSLSTALIAGLGGVRPLPAALRTHHRTRDRSRRRMYDLTTGMSTFRPDRLGRWLYPAVAGHPTEPSRFLGGLSGTDPAYFTTPNVLRLLVRGGWTRAHRAATHPLATQPR